MSALQASSLSLSILSVVKFLERFGYYGMRSVLILYAVDEAELGIDHSTAFTYYGLFTAAVYLLNLPMGMVSDFLLKQRNGTIVGLSIFLLGYLILIFPNIYAVFIALILISIGGGLVNPNLIVMVGRLYNKQDHQRNIGFAIFIIAVNIGAVLSSGIMIFVQEAMNYHFCFLLSALASLLALIVFIIFARNMEVKEFNTGGETQSIVDQHPEILDYKTGTQPPPLRHLRNVFSPSRFIVIILISLFAGIFWQLYEIIGQHQVEIFPYGTNVDLFGMDISYFSFRSMLDMIVLFVGSLLLIVLWLNNKLKSSVIVIAMGFIFLLLTMFLFYYLEVSGVSASSLFFLAFLFSGLLGLADACFTTVALSYVTRLSHVRFSSTTVGIYLLGSGLIIQFFQLTGMGFIGISLLLLAIIPLVIIVFLLVGRNLLKGLADGIE